MQMASCLKQSAIFERRISCERKDYRRWKFFFELIVPFVNIIYFFTISVFMR